MKERQLRITNYELQNMTSGGVPQCGITFFAMSAAAAPMMPPTSPCPLWAGALTQRARRRSYELRIQESGSGWWRNRRHRRQRDVCATRFSPCPLWRKSFNTESTEILRVLCVEFFQRTERTEKTMKKL
jgi:hypothetical protein